LQLREHRNPDYTLSQMAVKHLKMKEGGRVEFPIGKGGKSIYINYDWCKGCGVCIAFCPKEVFDASALEQPVPTRIEGCTQCMICVHGCPDFAIVISDTSGKAKMHPEAELIAKSNAK